MQRITTLLLSLLFLSGLNGCSFQLRDSYQLPTNLQAVRLDSIDSFRTRSQLDATTATAGIQVVDASNSTTIVRILSDQLERRTLSLFESGQVAEYELIYQINYRGHPRRRISSITDKSGSHVTTKMILTLRSPKTRERELLVSEMQDGGATRRLVRQLITEFSD